MWKWGGGEVWKWGGCGGIEVGRVWRYGSGEGVEVWKWAGCGGMEVGRVWRWGGGEGTHLSGPDEEGEGGVWRVRGCAEQVEEEGAVREAGNIWNQVLPEYLASVTIETVQLDKK